MIPGFAGGGAGGRALVLPGVIHPTFSFTRASAGWGFVNGVLTAFAGGAPRWVDYPTGGLGLLMEPARTNLIRNPRGENGVAGSPGTLPTNWFAGIPSGITRTLAFGTEFGLSFCEIAFSGTTTLSVQQLYVLFEGNNTMPAVSGQTVTGRVYHRLVAGSVPAAGTPIAVSINETTSSGGYVTGGSAVSSVPSSLLSGAATIRTLVGGVTVAAAQFLWLADNIPVGTVINFTVRLYTPQVEIGSGPTSIILPVAGTPAATTRAVDNLVATNFPWLDAAQGTIAVEGALNSAAVDASPRSIFQVSDGTSNNVFRALYGAAGSEITSVYRAAGVTTNPGSVAGLFISPRKIAYGHSLGVNGVGVSVNSAAPVYSSPAAAPAGFNQVRLGSSFVAGEEFNGIIREARYFPTRVSDAALQVLSIPAPRELLNATQNRLDPALTFTRSSAGWGFVGGVLTPFGANAPRWVDDGLLLEGARTNSVRNPRCEGFSTNSEPANWHVTGPLNGLTRTRVGSGTENGLNYVDYRWDGTTTANTNLFIYVEGLTNGIAAAQNQTFSQQFCAKLAAGSWPATGTQSLVWRGVDSSGALTSDFALVPITAPTGAALSSQRYTATRTMNGATTAWTTGGWRLSDMAVGTVVDFTIRLALPQIELGATASSPILPAVGTPAATTRAADSLATVSLATLIPGGARTIVGSAIMSGFSAGDLRNVLEISDGTTSNRFLLRTDVGAINLLRVAAGAGSGNATAGTATNGVPFKFGLSYDTAGNGLASFNGGAAVSQPNGPASGLTNLCMGQQTGGGLSMFGTVSRLFAYPLTANATELATITGAA